ncbi:MAG: NPCBM/NEW2 domain-containing protein [bacterium]
MNKKILKIVLPIISVLLITCVVFFVTIGTKDNVLSDSDLGGYYDDLYGGVTESLDDLTDEELKQYYENLYGEGDQDLTEHENSSSSGTQYTFDYEDNTYIEYVALNKSKAYMVYDSSSKLSYKEDHQGNQISLLTEAGETKFTNGIASNGGAACFTYTDIKEQGYDEFSSYIGAHSLARITSSTSTSFNVRFMCDGETVYTTQTFNKDSLAEYVQIDLTGVKVFQMFIETQGSGNGDYIGLGDPKFTKEEAKAYLNVFDLEFNLPNQVIPENILEYATAKDIDGNDISDDITYETDYVKGQTGEYYITYSIKQTVLGEEVERRDTVKLTVDNIDYSQTWTLEDFKKPYANYMYQGRQGYPEQKKRLFDICVNLGLDYDEDLWREQYRAAYGTTYHYRDVNLYDNQVYLSKGDVNNIMTGVSESEPRTFMLFNMDIFIYYSTDTTTGLIKTWGLFCQNLTTQQYEDRVEQILSNSETFLSAAKDDMTYAQKWKYVTDAYNSKVTYTDGANLYNSMGILKAKCNGNSMGLVFLAQRLNMKSIYASGGTYAGYHAWSYQKLPDDNVWYLTDKLWYTTLGTVEGYTSSHSVSKNRGYTFPEVSDKAYASSNYTYPSIWMGFNNNSFVIDSGESIDIEGNINNKQIDGIFSDILTKAIISFDIKDEFGNSVGTDTSVLSGGNYTIEYILNYKNDLYDMNRTYNIPLLIVSNKEDYNTDNFVNGSNHTYKADAGVYNGSTEERYAGYNINNAGYITIANDNYDTISLKFSATEAVRNDSYATANCRISLSVYFDGVLQTTTATISAYSTYIQLDLYIPEGVSEIKLKVNAVSNASTHGCIADIKFGRFD